MAQFHIKKTHHRRNKWIMSFVALIIIGLLTLVVGTLIARRWYSNALQPISTSTEVRRIKIESGMNVDDIAMLLEDEGLIRSAQVFKTYVRGENVASDLKAGEFELSPSWSVSEIVSVLVSGKEASELFTIGPGLRLDQIKKRLIDYGFSEIDVNKALEPRQYVNHPALLGKPDNASLEGYIFPESFRITSTTTVSEIIEQSLDELADKLKPELLESISQRKLSLYDALTIGSIIEKEVSGLEDRKKVAQVFFKRIELGMPLGADATYLYAAAVFGGEPFPDNPSEYNTRIYTGLPPGPISNVSLTALQAVADPSPTDYLYYVTGDDGINYFTSTAEEHEAMVAEKCTITCAPGYIAE